MILVLHPEYHKRLCKAMEKKSGRVVAKLETLNEFQIEQSDHEYDKHGNPAWAFYPESNSDFTQHIDKMMQTVALLERDCPRGERNAS